VAVRVAHMPPPASAPTVAILVAHMQLIVTVPSVASLVVPTYPVALARSVAVWVSKPHIKQTRFWESRGAMKKGRLTHLPSELKDIVADHQQLKRCYWRGGYFIHARPGCFVQSLLSNFRKQLGPSSHNPRPSFHNAMINSPIASSHGSNRMRSSSSIPA